MKYLNNYNKNDLTKSRNEYLHKIIEELKKQTEWRYQFMYQWY